tara:strand:+ start:271 stop:1245 length:975 start_codon:yes stop_codon:yes gene_type:complete
MAFKMKGSPHKMGTMEGTSAHKSALKAYKTMKKYGNDAVKFGSTEGKSTPNKMGKDHKTMSYMKTPYEQAKPDYLDMDKDGDEKESMKEAIDDKKEQDKSSNLKQKIGKKEKKYKEFEYSDETKSIVPKTEKVDKPKGKKTKQKPSKENPLPQTKSLERKKRIDTSESEKAQMEYELTGVKPKIKKSIPGRPVKKGPLPQSCPDGSAPVPLDEEGNPLMQKNIIKKVKGTVKNIAKNIGRGIRNKKRKKLHKKLKRKGVLRQEKKEIGSTTYLGAYSDGSPDVVGKTMSPQEYKKSWQKENSGPGWKTDYNEYLAHKKEEAEKN